MSAYCVVVQDQQGGNNQVASDVAHECFFTSFLCSFNEEKTVNIPTLPADKESL